MNNKIKNNLKSLIIVIIAAMSFFSALSPEYCAAFSQSEIDGAFSENAGVSSEWYVIGLRQNAEGEIYDFSNYRAALLEYMEKNETVSASTRLKYALSLAACGNEADINYINEILCDAYGKQGLMSYVFSLHLLNNGFECEGVGAEALVEKLLSFQLEDGGWAVFGTNGDVDATAMTLQAFAPYYEENADVTTAVKKALALLSERMSEEGDFSSYGVYNCESTAQVIIALSALGIDCGNDEAFLKSRTSPVMALEKYRIDGNDFSHTKGGEKSQIASSQAFCASVAYERMKSGKGPFFVFDKIDPSIFETETPAAETASPVPETASPITPKGDKQQSEINVKTWICAGIVAMGGIICIVLIVAGKRNIKNFIVVLVIVAVGVGAVLVSDISLPEDYYGNETEQKNIVGSITLEIKCDTLDKAPVLEKTSFDIEDGDTVFDVLTRAAKKHGIHIEHSGTTAMSDSLAYVSGINYIYEAQYGDLSGWVYFVNGQKPSVGCGEYVLKDGDRVEWHYSLTMGNDIVK